MPIVSVSLPQALLSELDQLAKHERFSGRSEVVRAALQTLLAEERANQSAKAKRSATLTVVYPKGHERRIAEIRHDYSDVVKSMMHSDLEADCVEVYLLQGPADRLRGLVDRVLAHRQVRIARNVYTDQA